MGQNQAMNSNQIVSELESIVQQIHWGNIDVLQQMKDVIIARRREIIKEQQIKTMLESFRAELRASISDAPENVRRVMSSIQIEEVRSHKVTKLTIGFDRDIIFRSLDELNKSWLKDFTKILIADYADSFV